MNKKGKETLKETHSLCSSDMSRKTYEKDGKEERKNEREMKLIARDPKV